MNSFCKKIMLFILVHAIAIIPLIAPSSSEPDQGHHDDNNMYFLWFDKWQVHVVNDLSNTKIF
ncbi:hypothetical protein ES332_A08G225000v1 [Gossypium tomentosum]|uniref:Uncharacterized protein n=1 Tax=Gossypium tomentosum TaxID=34277 RepID=A0A5D2PMA8_GOSTO|nr:hypothetical protein ES332_A08G225000v1 [Gossypium tomentosum]